LKNRKIEHFRKGRERKKNLSTNEREREREREKKRESLSKLCRNLIKFQDGKYVITYLIKF